MIVHYLDILVLVTVSAVHGIHNGQLLCSHCQGHTDKQQCNNFQLCHNGEQCFTTTYTINGLTRLFTGCMPQSDCSTLGFTSVDQKGQLPPGSAIVQQQCCDTDGCNGLQGMGDRTACMSCSEDEKTAVQCQHAVLCNPGQECMYYQFMETSNYQTRIRLNCVNHEVCEMLRRQPPIFGKREELAMKKHCCKTDYCNMFWGQPPQNSSNTQTTRKTTTPTTTGTSKTTLRTTTKKPTSPTTLTTKPATTGQQTHVTQTNKPMISITLVTLTNPHTTHTQHTHSTPGHHMPTTHKPTHSHGQHTPTVEQHTPTPEQHTPTPEQHTPTPEQHTPTPEQHTPTVEQHTPTQEQHTPTIVHPQTVTPSTLIIPSTQPPATTQPTTPRTTPTTVPTTTTVQPTTTVPTTTTEPPANRCYSSSKDSNTQTIVGCPDEAPYCLNNVTNYGNGKTAIAKGCASAAQCYWIPKESSSFYCDRYSSSHIYFADFACFYCCTGELCNVDAVASPASPFNPAVIPPNPISHPPVKSTECYICDDCHGAGALSTCSGNTPFCLNRYTNSQWGVSHISKRCGTKQECHDMYYEGSRYQLLCSLFDEHVSENMRLDCTFCCTTPQCNEHARPPPETLYKE